MTCNFLKNPVIRCRLESGPLSGAGGIIRNEYMRHLATDDDKTVTPCPGAAALLFFRQPARKRRGW